MQLDRVIQVTNRRVNALELIVIPRIESVVKYIDQELEEQERESKYIAKKVVANNHRNANKDKKFEESEEEFYEEEEEQLDYFMDDHSEVSDDDLF